MDLDHPPGLLIELDPATPAAEVHVTEHHDFVAVLPKDLAMDLPDLELSSIVAVHSRLPPWPRYGSPPEI